MSQRSRSFFSHKLSNKLQYLKLRSKVPASLLPYVRKPLWLVPVSEYTTSVQLSDESTCMSCFVLFPSTSKKLQEIYCLYENTKKKLGSLATNPPLFFFVLHSFKENVKFRYSSDICNKEGLTRFYRLAFSSYHMNPSQKHKGMLRVST